MNASGAPSHARNRSSLYSDVMRAPVEMLRTLVARRLALRLLPREQPTSEKHGAGTGERCAACVHRIETPENEVDVGFRTAPLLRLHLDCYEEWRRQRM